MSGIDQPSTKCYDNIQVLSAGEQVHKDCHQDCCKQQNIHQTKVLSGVRQKHCWKRSKTMCPVVSRAQPIQNTCTICSVLAKLEIKWKLYDVSRVRTIDLKDTVLALYKDARSDDVRREMRCMV